jgi:hypothetical protein
VWLITVANLAAAADLLPCQVVTYYIMQSKANNHAVREAACACIAELMIKVEPDAVRPHVQQLLAALLLAFKDASWPVRSSASHSFTSLTHHVTTTLPALKHLLGFESPKNTHPRAHSGPRCRVCGHRKMCGRLQGDSPIPVLLCDDNLSKFVFI